MSRILALSIFLGVSYFGFGQGSLNFVNSSSTLISTNSLPGGPATGPILGPPGNYYFALFVAPSGTVDTVSFTFFGAYATNTATTGRLFGRDQYSPEGGGVEVPGYSAGSWIAVLIRGWSGNIGHDWAQVTHYLANPTFDGWYGESEIGLVLLGGATPSTPIFGSRPEQMPGFTLEILTVPEPSSSAIVGLGMALWLSRRRSR